MKYLFLIVPALVAYSGCTSGTQAEWEIFHSLGETATPAGTGSGQPFLFAGEDGLVLLTWIEGGVAKNHALRFSQFRGGEWEAPVTIIEGDDFFVNWADVPSIFRASDGTLAVHWLESSGDWIFAYDVKVSMSEDGGATWTDPITPHSDGTQTEHGFASFYNHPAGGIGIVWLDGREAEQQGVEFGGHDHGGDWNMHLRTTAIRPGSQMAEEVLLDGRVCECCPTAAAETGTGVLIAYRNRSDDEIRDIYLVRYENDRWSEAYPLHHDGWNIAGCPVNGPALSARENRVVAAWYTASDNDPRVYVAFSRDGGRTFGTPYRIHTAVPLGRVAVELLDDRSALVMWIEQHGESAAVLVRRVYPDGTMTNAEKIATVSDDRSSGYPRMARVGDTVVFAWTDTFEGSQVRTAVGRLRQ